MKLKKLSLLAGAIAVAFSITPLAANAQVNSNAPQRVAQANRPSPPRFKVISGANQQNNPNSLPSSRSNPSRSHSRTTY